MTFEDFLKSLNLESRSDHYKKDKYNKTSRNPDRAGRRREDEKNTIRRFYIMLLARRNNSVSNWLNSWFNDNFFDTDLMPRMNATAPAVNVKENATAYTMEVAAPGLKKDMVKMNIDKDGYLNVSIENKDEKKEEKKEEHYLRREFSYSNYSQSYALPEDADQEKISAEVSDGVLKIEIPKVAKEEKKEDVKHIEIK